MDRIIKEPGCCSERELQRFMDLLSQRTSIDQKNIKRRILRAHTLAFVYVESFLVGIGALKYAMPGFRRRVLEGQSINLLKELPDKELGWIFVNKDFRGRGIGSAIVSGLIEAPADNQVFSLTEDKNFEMRKILHSSGFCLYDEIELENHRSYLLYIKDQ